MKERTYNILSHIPIAGTIVEIAIGRPLICSPMIEECPDIHHEISEYKKAHPGKHISRKIFNDEILGNRRTGKQPGRNFSKNHKIKNLTDQDLRDYRQELIDEFDKNAEKE